MHRLARLSEGYAKQRTAMAVNSNMWVCIGKVSRRAAMLWQSNEKNDKGRKGRIKMSVKAYKGFNKDMTCRDFQFKEGETYHEDEASLSNKGFHACIDPLDCFEYYSPNESVYHEVELDDVTSEKAEDSKICGKTIRIGAKVDIARMVKASIELIINSIKKSKDKQEASGYGSKLAASGDWSQLALQGKRSVAMCAGIDCRAKGKIGDWIVLTEWAKDKNDELYPKYVKAGKITSKALKPDTWYILKNGKFVEVSEDEQE